MLSTLVNLAMKPGGKSRFNLAACILSVIEVAKFDNPPTNTDSQPLPFYPGVPQSNNTLCPTRLIVQTRQSSDFRAWLLVS